MIVPFQPSHVNIDRGLIEAIANSVHFIEKAWLWKRSLVWWIYHHL